MVDLLNSLKARKYGRYVFLTIWVAIVAITATIVVQRRSITYPTQFSDVNSMFPENQITGFACHRYDPNTNKLCFAVSAGSILAENATVGIFKTAAARKVKIKDLQLYICKSFASSMLPALHDKAPSESPVSGKNTLQGVIGQMAEGSDNWRININFSNTCEVAIENLYCRIFDDDGLGLTVQSRRAIADSHWPKITLQGHVTVTSANGGILESNHVTWDTQKQRFTADGIYLLRRGDKRISGKGICVDSELNIAGKKIAME